MASGKQVAEELKEAHKTAYGSRRELAQLFGGGNVGTAFLGLCFKEGAALIATSISELARAIASKSSTPPVTNNYYQAAQPPNAPTNNKKGKATK